MVKSQKSEVEEVRITRAPNELPEYLRDTSVKGLEETKKYVMHQRLRIVQKQSDSNLLNQFPIGTVLLSPSLVEVAPMEIDNKGKPTATGLPFCFYVLFFFPSWGQMNPLILKGKEPLFYSYTTDDKNPIAAKSKNKATREEPHPTVAGEKLKNVEMLNFVVVVDDPRFIDDPAILTFAKGEWFTGSRFLSRIRNTKASIFSRRWQGQSRLRSRNSFEWMGVDVVEPDDGALWVASKEQNSAFEKMHDDLRAEHLKSGLKPEGLDDIASESEAEEESTAAASAQY